MTYSCGPLHIDGQRQHDQLESMYNSSVPIQDVAMKTSREQWMTEKGGRRGSGRSVLAALHDDYMKHITISTDEDEQKYAPLSSKCYSWKITGWKTYTDFNCGKSYCFVVVNVLCCDIVVTSSKSSPAITFTHRPITLGKVWYHLILSAIGKILIIYRNLHDFKHFFSFIHNLSTNSFMTPCN